MRVVEKQTPCIQTWYYKLGLLLKDGGWKETEIEIKRDREIAREEEGVSGEPLSRSKILWQFKKSQTLLKRFNVWCEQCTIETNSKT